MPTYYTIGHSTRSVPELIGLLQSAGVELLADVRAFPRSRTNPQFNIEALPPELAAHGIAYEHFSELGGRRGRSANSANDFWKNDSFRNYADYAATETFRSALDRLRTLGATRRTAIMCAEAVWWRCHRRIIADYLICAGDAVFHILGAGNIEPAKLTPAARVVSKNVLVYPK
jgi:uncharacterized protein (DUF488 family)